ncbi:MAG: DUF192 domain-containing protein [Cyanobacteria bacterium P01_H01_bin.58]
MPESASCKYCDRLCRKALQASEEQATGLMFRETLADDQGMLFLVDLPRPIIP